MYNLLQVRIQERLRFIESPTSENSREAQVYCSLLQVRIQERLRFIVVSYK